MGIAASVVFALDPLESFALAVRELSIVCVSDLRPLHTEIEAVIPDEEFFFLLIRRAKLAALACPMLGFGG